MLTAIALVLTLLAPTLGTEAFMLAVPDTTVEVVQAEPTVVIDPAADDDQEHAACDQTGGGIDAACVLRKTVLALRIRFLVENWTEDGDESLSSRLTEALCEAKLQSNGCRSENPSQNPDNTARRCTANACKAVLFVFNIAEGSAPEPPVPIAEWPSETSPPTEADLRSAYDALKFFFPRRLTVPLDPATAARTALGDVSYRLFTPAGDELITTAAGGAGVSFQQALVEGVTAFLLDRARADLARAGLEAFNRELRDSPLRGAFANTLQLSGFSGPDEDAYQDPRLYLHALQTTLATDFDAMPAFIALRLREGNAFGLQPYEWEVAVRSLRLVADVQRGTHPLLALSSFAGAPLPVERQSDSRVKLQRRLYELSAVSSALYAGVVESEGQILSTRDILRSLDGRRLLAHFLTHEVSRALGDTTTLTKIEATEARVVALLQTLDDIVRELDELQGQFAEIRAANPDQAAAVYADYIAVITRAVRQVIVETSGEGSSTQVPSTLPSVLVEVERLLAVREAVVRRDYAGAVTLAMPYLSRIAGEVGGPQFQTAVQGLAGALPLLSGQEPTGSARQTTLAAASRGLTAMRTTVAAATALADQRESSIHAIVALYPTGPVRDAIHPLLEASEGAVDKWEDVAQRLGDAENTVQSAKGDSLPDRWWQILQTNLQDALNSAREAYTAEIELFGTAQVAVDPLLHSTKTAEEAKELLRSLIAEFGTERSKLGQIFVAASALASARSSEDVYRTLVIYAAPPGSFRARRGERARTSIALNAYVGGVVGYEWAEDDGCHGGFFIPVGVELSWPWNLVDGSFGIFLAPINLGTYADGRIDTTAAPAYSFAQLFSPSGSLVVGLSRTIPVSLGLNLSYVPEFREVGPEGMESARSASRISFFAAIDIPLAIWQFGRR